MSGKGREGRRRDLFYLCPRGPKIALPILTFVLPNSICRCVCVCVCERERKRERREAYSIAGNFGWCKFSYGPL